MKPEDLGNYLSMSIQYLSIYLLLLLLDDDVVDDLYAQIARNARIVALKTRQSSIYTAAGIQDEYIDWRAFETLWVCRVRGCRRAGLSFAHPASIGFLRHLASKAHQVCISLC